MRHYDCAVIGTGPAGQKAAIQAAKLGKKVCIIEKTNVLGGAQINTGTIPSKALREAVMHLTGAGKRELFGDSHRVKRDITISDLIYVSRQVIHHELSIIRAHFDRNGVDLIWGTPSSSRRRCGCAIRSPARSGSYGGSPATWSTSGCDIRDESASLVTSRRRS